MVYEIFCFFVWKVFEWTEISKWIMALKWRFRIVIAKNNKGFKPRWYIGQIFDNYLKEEYYNENRDMFEEVSHEDNVDREDGNIIEASSKYIDYKIEQMKNVSDKIKYTLIFELEKEDNEWKVLEISDIDRKKLHGLFYE